MIILVINCGSSSIKYQLLDMRSDDDYGLLAKGIVEKIGLPMSVLTHKPVGKDPVVKELPISDHKVGMQLVLEELVNPVSGVLKSFDDIDAVGHRVVQGADFFSESVLVDEGVLEKIAICSDFAPLHNPANILGIRAVQQVLPEVPQAVVFDTAFHQTMPDYAYMYALPYEYYEKYRVRRYGAHGTSHQFVAYKGAAFCGLDIKHSKIITCHIGNGSSITAVENGKVVDTTMGFTPLEGLVMGTRCGTIDPSVVTYIMKKENLSPDQMTDIMNKKSGFLGLSGGISSDARDIDEAYVRDNDRARLILTKLCYDIIKTIGAYAAEMNGVDLIVFTAGLGENNCRLRRRVCDNLTYLGVKFNYEANMVKAVDTLLTCPDSKVKVALITTDEELVIARDTMHLVTGKKA